VSNLNKRQGYRQVLYENYHTSGNHKNFSELSLKRLVKDIDARFRGWLPSERNISVLDMGCGNGYFLCALNHMGFTDLIGVDIGEKQVLQARVNCPQARIFHGDVKEFLSQHPESFDLITGFDLIEHFSKDEVLPLLHLIAKSMKKGGRVILQTPNAGSPWVGEVAYGDFTHEWFFTPASLANLLERVGLKGFAARPCQPYVHGLRSMVRVVLWKIICFCRMIVNLVETGGRGNGVNTRVFAAIAFKINNE